MLHSATNQRIEARGAPRTVRILGTHGIPANYGGFETAAENVALYLASKGWRVVVYCQSEGNGPITEDTWHGIERVIIPVYLPGWRGTSKFDWLSIAHACRFRDVCLTFGYNTGVYNFRQRLLGIPNIVNMDGIEWSRSRWGWAKQTILYVNERFAALFGNHLIADHPEIEKYLWTRAPRRKITTITYGADPVVDPLPSHVRGLGLEPGGYLTLIARPIPENSILELIAGFSARHRGKKLVVLGKIDPRSDPYHRELLSRASNEVVFPGAIYNKAVVQALRYYGVAYLHGHTVGGTNPSLVEAMAAGNPVIAHDNLYNRWVARDAAVFFCDSESADRQITFVLADETLRRCMGQAALSRFEEEFTWTHVGRQYEELIECFLPSIRSTVGEESERVS